MSNCSSLHEQFTAQVAALCSSIMVPFKKDTFLSSQFVNVRQFSLTYQNLASSITTSPLLHNCAHRNFLKISIIIQEKSWWIVLGGLHFGSSIATFNTLEIMYTCSVFPVTPSCGFKLDELTDTEGKSEEDGQSLALVLHRLRNAA